MAQRQADVVEPLEKPPAGVLVDPERRDDLAGGHHPRHQVDEATATALLKAITDDPDLVVAVDVVERMVRAPAVGIDPNILTASLKAVISAVNRAM